MEKYFVAEHIGVFDGFYSKRYCKELIDFFEFRNNFNYALTRDGEKQQDLSVTLGHEIDFHAENNVVTSVTEEVVADTLLAPKLINHFSEVFWSKCYNLYLKHHVYNEQLAKMQFSNFKIQKTTPGQGYHIFHFENQDILTSKRVMFVILYLNHIEEGGETEFLYQKKRIEPKTGRLVLAPAAYTHAHRGNPPLAETKYILTSWLEYTA
jgi:hypothetical protein